MKLPYRIFAAFLCVILFMATAAPALAILAESVPACDCGNESTDLTSHTDSCARKSYIRNTYIRNNSAEQICSDWNSLDEDVQNAVLTFLSWDDYTKYTALTELLNNQTPDDGSYPTTGSEKVEVDISFPDGAFPEGTTSQIEPIDAKEYCSDIEGSLSEIDDASKILALYALDISFICNEEKVQPSESVEITFTVPAELIPENAQTAMIFHMVDYGVEDEPNYFDISGTGEQSFTISTDSFSSYVIAMTSQNHKATLLRDALTNQNYSIVTFPINMFKYDTDVFNAACRAKAGNDNYLKFVIESNDATFAPNTGGAVATQGILKSSLDQNGMPVMAYGYNNGEAVFGTSSFTGKTIYKDVQFEFIYDKITGYYQYNSAINHAELNNGRVELYTDTMGPYNYRVGISMDHARQSANLHDMKLVSDSSGIIELQTTGTDPRLALDHTNRAIANYGYLYFRIYSSHAQTTSEGDGLFLTFDFADDGTGDWGDGSAELDLKAGWNEYYFDLSQYSGKTLARTSVNFSSKSGVTIKISQMGFVKTAGLNTAMTNAGFYPFSNIATSYLNGDYTTFDETVWEYNLNHAATQERATRSFLNKEYAEPAPTDNFHFGLTMKLDFYLPSDKKTDAGEDIIFEFSGDDDLWIFVDGKLILDVGGLHTRIGGKINFTEGTTVVDTSRVITGTTQVGSTVTDRETTFSIEPGYHTVQIFYLERASTASNCRFYFNLPTVPTGDVMVSKKVVDESGLVNVDSLTFDYVMTVNSRVLANVPYDVVTYDANGKIVSTKKYTTDANGGFTLKHNQTAFINDIDENLPIKVLEIPDSRFVTTVNGTNSNVYEDRTVDGKTIHIEYVNTVKLTSIVIEKKASPISVDIDSAENQSFLFHVKGSDALTENVDISVVIDLRPEDVSGQEAANSVTIVNIPVGLYTVTEDTRWSWRYEPVEQTLTQNAVSEDDANYQTNNVFSFENERKKIYWLSGDNIAHNHWGADNKVKRDDQAQ